MLNFYFIKIVTSLWRNNKIRRGIKIFLVIENASIDARHTAIPICALYARPFATDIILWPHINAGANQTCMRVMRHQHGARLARHCRALVYLPFAIGSIFPTPSLFLSLRSLLYFSSLRSRAQVARALGFRAPVSAARTRAKISQTDTHTHRASYRHEEEETLSRVFTESRQARGCGGEKRREAMSRDALTRRAGFS